MNESRAPALTLRQVALAAVLLYFILIGGTNVGTYVTAFAAINALIAAALIGLWVVELPRNNDLTDRLLLGALLAFLLTCVTSAFPRMSFDAATSLMAAVAAFGIARGELASMRAERVMITVLALCGLVLGMGFLALWIPYWIEWWQGTGAAPPLDLPLPPGHYWHFHFAAMRCDLLRASTMLADADNAVDDRAWLAATLMLSSLRDDADAYRAAVEIAVLRRNELALPARTDPGPRTLFADFDEDIALYKTLPLAPADLAPLLPTQAEGLAAWLQDPRQAARRGAPQSRLATC